MDRTTTAAIGTLLLPLLLAIEGGAQAPVYDTLWMTVWDHEFTTPDFQCRGNTPPSPCFGGDPDILTDLGTDGKPHSTSNPRVTDWFRTGVEYCRQFILRRDTADTNLWVYPPNDTQNYFFPIDEVPSNSMATGQDGARHNFAFCDELHGIFRYRGGEEFSFTGDDDLFLFINGKLAVDMGGTHNAMTRNISLDERAHAVKQAFDPVDQQYRGPTLPSLDIDTGNYYTFDLFHCERQTNASNFNIRMSLDVLPPLPPGYHIGLAGGAILPDGDTVEINIADGPSRFYAYESLEDSRQLNCKTVVVGTLLPVTADWTFGGASLAAMDSIVTVDPAGHVAGTYTLRMTVDTTVKEIVVRLVGTPKVAAVVANPPSTSFSDSLSVTLSTATAGALIFYTLDGTDPTQASTPYAGTISLRATTTILARAFKQGSSPSDIMRESYTYSPVTLPAVTATPPGTTFQSSLTVVLSTTEAGVAIYCTLDGTEPTQAGTPYAGPISFSASTTIKARGFKQGFLPGPVMTEVYTKTLLAVGACYRDLNADGRIETAVIQFDTALGQVPATLTLQDPFGGASQTLAAGDMELLDGQVGIPPAANAIVATLRTPFSAGTDFAASAYGTVGAGGVYAGGSVVIADSVAPVATQAVYRPGSSSGTAGERYPDTLVVGFSEEVTVAMAGQVRPFVLSQSGTTYLLVLRALPSAAGSTEMAFVVDSILGVEYPTNSDSLWLAVGEVTGRDGLVQRNPGNRRVPLRVTLPPVSLSQAALTPVVAGPNGTPIPPSIRSSVAEDLTLPGEERARMASVTTGTFITVTPSTGSTTPGFRINGDVTVYDAVGNVVVAKQTMAVDSRHRLVWVWDARNQHGRYVGTGTYLAIVRREDSVGGTTVVRERIGIAR